MGSGPIEKIGLYRAQRQFGGHLRELGESRFGGSWKSIRGSWEGLKSSLKSLTGSLKDLKGSFEGLTGSLEGLTGSLDGLTKRWPHTEIAYFLL